jgi:hypothetical protein
MSPARSEVIISFIRGVSFFVLCPFFCSRHSRPGDCFAIRKVSFLTYVRNLNELYLLKTRFLASK